MRFLSNAHTHTTYCDGKSSAAEMIEKAKELAELVRISEEQEKNGVGVGLMSTYDNTPQNVMPWWVSLIPTCSTIQSLR